MSECSASIYYDRGESYPLVNFSYGSPAEISPELDSITTWLAEALWPYQNFLPGNFCTFQTLTIECGAQGCDPLTEVCVILHAHSISPQCMPVPLGCENDRSCACLGSTVCSGTYNACVDSWENDVVNCNCLQCN